MNLVVQADKAVRKENLVGRRDKASWLFFFVDFCVRIGKQEKTIRSTEME